MVLAPSPEQREERAVLESAEQETVMKAASVHWLILASLGAALLLGGLGAQTAESSPPPETPAAAQEPGLRCGRPSSLLIDDLEDGDASTPDGLGGWYLGPAPQLPADAARLPVPGGPGSSQFAAHSISPGGPGTAGWIGVALGCARDARRLDGYRFAIKGSGSFHAKVVTPDTTSVEAGGTCPETDTDPATTDCGDHYSTELLALPDADWYECSVRFDDLEQLGWGTSVQLELEAVTGVEIVPEAETAFDLTLDDVRFAEDVAGTGCGPLEPRRQPRR
jgi:hypothetical protein